MNKAKLEDILRRMESDNDGEAIGALRELQDGLKEKGVDLGSLLAYAMANIADVAPRQQVQIAAPAAPTAITVSGTPQCVSPRPGSIEIVIPGAASGDVVVIPGAGAEQSDVIAMGLKDALVAAAINKSRFKLKLLDIKNHQNIVVETALQAEYERPGMVPIRVWGHEVRGEVASVAAVLRKAITASMPELVAS